MQGAIGSNIALIPHRILSTNEQIPNTWGVLVFSLRYSLYASNIRPPPTLFRRSLKHFSVLKDMTIARLCLVSLHMVDQLRRVCITLILTSAIPQ